MSQLADLLSARIAELGITQNKAAMRCGMPRQNISALVKDESARRLPREETIARLANGLGLDNQVLKDAAAADAGYAPDPEFAALQATWRGLTPDERARFRRLIEAAVDLNEDSSATS